MAEYYRARAEYLACRKAGLPRSTDCLRYLTFLALLAVLCPQPHITIDVGLNKAFFDEAQGSSRTRIELDVNETIGKLDDLDSKLETVLKDLDPSKITTLQEHLIRTQVSAVQGKFTPVNFDKLKSSHRRSAGVKEVRLMRRMLKKNRDSLSKTGTAVFRSFRKKGMDITSNLMTMGNGIGKMMGDDPTEITAGALDVINSVISFAPPPIGPLASTFLSIGSMILGSLGPSKPSMAEVIEKVLEKELDERYREEMLLEALGAQRVLQTMMNTIKGMQMAEFEDGYLLEGDISYLSSQVEAVAGLPVLAKLKHFIEKERSKMAENQEDTYQEKIEKAYSVMQLYKAYAQISTMRLLLLKGAKALYENSAYTKGAEYGLGIIIDDVMTTDRRLFGFMETMNEDTFLFFHVYLTDHAFNVPDGMMLEQYLRVIGINPFQYNEHIYRWALGNSTGKPDVRKKLTTECVRLIGHYGPYNGITYTRHTHLQPNVKRLRRLLNSKSKDENSFTRFNSYLEWHGNNELYHEDEYPPTTCFPTVPEKCF